MQQAQDLKAALELDLKIEDYESAYARIREYCKNTQIEPPLTHRMIELILDSKANEVGVRDMMYLLFPEQAPEPIIAIEIPIGYLILGVLLSSMALTYWYMNTNE